MLLRVTLRTPLHERSLLLPEQLAVTYAELVQLYALFVGVVGASGNMTRDQLLRLPGEARGAVPAGQRSGVVPHC